MIFEASQFVFTPAPAVARARRILIKPAAQYPFAHPITTSRETLKIIIDGIRRVSDADIIILEGTSTGESIYPIYKALGYDFPHVLMLDVKDCIWVEVENPLLHPFAIATFWVPNVVLSSDYLISVSPYQIRNRNGYFTIPNLMSLLPIAKYGGKGPDAWSDLHSLGIQKVLADLYFTLPFDLGVVDARKRLLSEGDVTAGTVEDYGKTYMGEPYEVDTEATLAGKADSEYLKLIDMGRVELEVH